MIAISRLLSCVDCLLVAAVTGKSDLRVFSISDYEEKLSIDYYTTRNRYQRFSRDVSIIPSPRLISFHYDLRRDTSRITFDNSFPTFDPATTTHCYISGTTTS